VKELDAELPVIMISGHGNIETGGERHQARRLRIPGEAVQVDRLLLLIERALEALRSSAKTAA